MGLSWVLGRVQRIRVCCHRILDAALSRCADLCSRDRLHVHNQQFRFPDSSIWAAEANLPSQAPERTWPSINADTLGVHSRRNALQSLSGHSLLPRAHDIL